MSNSSSPIINPGAQSWELLRQRHQYVARGIDNATEIFAARAEGAIIEDIEGNRYIDFAGGYGAMNVGHTRPQITQAIADQAARFTHTCFSGVMYESYVTLARRLTTLVPGAFPKKAVFFNSGAEAVENAVKIARYATGRPAILVFENAFHGRTLMAMTMTAKVIPYKYRFGPYAPEIYRAPFPYPYRMNMSPQEAADHCLHEIEHMFTGVVAPDQVAAIVVEPVQGEGGFLVAPPGFLAGLKRLCELHGILFVADEIQTGFCRTGRMFAVEHDGVVPDLILVAKSLAAGMPLSGVVGRAEIMDVPPPGTLGGTYSGNPVACAAALAALDLFEQEDLATHSQLIGFIIQQRFQHLQQRFPCIGDIRGLGSMMALEIVTDRVSKEPDVPLVNEILHIAHQLGLILLNAGMYNNVLRVLVPLTVTDKQLEQGLYILEEAITRASAQRHTVRE